MKACQIFKMKQKIKIVTMYNTDTGSYKLDKPIFTLSIDEDREVLKNAITQSLAASKQIKFVPSDNSALLKDLKEKSFLSFYKTSTSCMVFVNDTQVTIEPQVFSKEIRALETNEEQIVRLFNFTEEELLNHVLKVL
ncbi:hypothetical protein [Hoylesella saccharolytica]|uniref:hypothetical protein n=1 Tax=Hoylesella saccharolytica TaxID=633701 RepID=UPI0004705257|nr:hypothetical protein [Hoylesella saccharolytica]